VETAHLSFQLLLILCCCSSISFCNKR
jgi:hypothetical protein